MRSALVAPAPSAALRVVLYARVSTTRQAEADLSIPHQVRQAETWSSRLGHTLVRQYIEPGASGTDETRPIFSQMMADAKAKPRTFDIILVHSLSRFARDNLSYAIAQRDLNKAGIAVQSITQPLGDNATGQMIESVIVAFDSYTSREISKHTSRGMKENARQGFWNGSRPPFGYMAVEAERRGEKVKKKAAVHEAEAAIVCRIFHLYRGVQGLQHGVKAIVSKLNAEGTTFRGKPFVISSVYRILTSSTYAGTHTFNVKDTKAGTVRPESDWIMVNVPPIIQEEAWAAVQIQLRERSPAKIPARTINNPTLLTGIASCGQCGAGMTLRTGKGYRYYVCAGRAQRAPTRCGGCSVPMPLVDNAVLDTLLDHVFAPDRLMDLVSGYLQTAATDAQTRRAQLGQMKAEATETEGAIARVVAMVEAGLLEIDDPSLRDRLQALKAKRAELSARMASAGSTIQQPRHLTEAKLTKLSVAVRQQLRDASQEMRKAYVRLFVDKVVVSRSEVRISGPQGALASAALEPLPERPEEVITFVRALASHTR